MWNRTSSEFLCIWQRCNLFANFHDATRQISADIYAFKDEVPFLCIVTWWWVRRECLWWRTLWHVQQNTCAGYVQRCQVFGVATAAGNARSVVRAANCSARSMLDMAGNRSFHSSKLIYRMYTGLCLRLIKFHCSSWCRRLPWKCLNRSDKILWVWREAVISPVNFISDVNF